MSRGIRNNQIKNLSEDDIVSCFNSAYKQMMKYKSKRGINISNEINYKGLNNNDKHCISIEYNKIKKHYDMYFSKHFIRNQKENVILCFERYMLVTNENPRDNNLFKKYNEIKNEMKKLPFETHLDRTYADHFLNTDVNFSNALICDQCKQIFYCDENDKALYESKLYRCECGGNLSSIINNVKQISSERLNDYRTKKTDGSDEYFDNEYHSELSFDKEYFLIRMNIEDDDEFEENYEEFNEFIKNKKKVTISQMKEMIIEHVQQKNVMMLNMLNYAFKVVYSKAYKTLKSAIRIFLLDNAKPIFGSIDVQKERNKIVNKCTGKCINIHNKNKVSLNREDYKCSDENFELIKSFIKSAKKNISNQQMIPMMTKLSIDENVEVLNILNEMYSDVYCSSFKYIRQKYRKFVLENCKPIDASFDEQKAWSTIKIKKEKCVAVKRQVKIIKKDVVINREDYKCSDETFKLMEEFITNNSRRKITRHQILPELKRISENGNMEEYLHMLTEHYHDMTIGSLRYCKKKHREYLCKVLNVTL